MAVAESGFGRHESRRVSGPVHIISSRRHLDAIQDLGNVGTEMFQHRSGRGMHTRQVLLLFKGVISAAVSAVPCWAQEGSIDEDEPSMALT